MLVNIISSRNQIRNYVLRCIRSYFNSLFFSLQQCAGFRKVRNRRMGAKSRASDSVGAGLYLFCNRKWKDPKKSEDVETFLDGIQALRESNPKLRTHLNREELVNEYISIVERWLHHMSSNSRSTQDVSTAGTTDSADDPAQLLVTLETAHSDHAGTARATAGSGRASENEGSDSIPEFESQDSLAEFQIDCNAHVDLDESMDVLVP